MIPDFIEVLKGDLSLLTVEGEPAPGQLKEAWEKLHAEYVELTKDDTVSHYLRETGRIEDLDGKIDRVNLYLNALLRLFNEEGITYKPILDRLASEGYPVRTTDEEVFLKDLELVPSLLKKKINDLKALLKKHDEFIAKTGNTPIDHIVGANIIAICESLKIDINENTLSVYRYCNYLNRIRNMK